MPILIIVGQRGIKKFKLIYNTHSGVSPILYHTSDILPLAVSYLFDLTTSRDSAVKWMVIRTE